MPRPGTGLPIQFASQEQINKNGALVDDFVKEILGLQWALLTDESSLWDFHHESNNEAFLSKIRDKYGVDVSYLEDAKIADILQAIASSKL